MKRLFLIVLAVVFTMALSGLPVFAEYPEKPIQLIVPFKPGGESTHVATLFQRIFKAHPGMLGAPLVVKHVPGAAGSIGARQVLNAEPDGYTFLLIHLALMSRHAAGLVDFGYKDFAPVAQTIGTCLVPSVYETSPYKTLPALLNAAKEKPDSIIFGVNLGALNHMAGLTVQNSSPGSKFRFVHTGHGNAVFVALKGGHNDVGIFSTGVYAKFKPGGIRGLAVMAEEPWPGLPELSTCIELGYDTTFCIQNWWFAPKDTPASAIDHFASALEKALETDEVKEYLESKYSTKSFLRGEPLVEHMDAVWRQIEPLAKQVKKK
jgi:putative tricarboxylic transport membrane protein